MFSGFFIERPRFATVVSALIVIAGIISVFTLPISQYPEVAPPQVQVRAAYPGASAETVATTVATPIEQEINGVEGMMYMHSQSTSDGNLTISVTFEPGTDLDTAQVLVQNRVSAAEPRLPEPVRRQGVTTVKNSPDILMVINLFAENDQYDQTFIGNYASLQIIDRLKRLQGVGNTQLVGASDYSMRLWLDADRLGGLNIPVEAVVEAVANANTEISSGSINTLPQPEQSAYELIVSTQGRLISADQFAEIIIKATPDGRLVRLEDVARTELGSFTYITKGYLGKNTAIAIPVFMRPGANALATADEIFEVMDELALSFPPGLHYRVNYNPTTYISASMAEVGKTLWQALLLVALVVVIFLQRWRTALVPVVAIPISLIGTFAVMALLGFSLNMLSLFGLVLAIGIVVDDAIVVVENIESKLRDGVPVLQATRDTMREVGGALVATSLVLVAVFLPTLMLGGITGAFYTQFGVTIAAATLISTVVSLTLSPALAAILMKTERPETKGLVARAADGFNRGLDHLANRYEKTTQILVRNRWKALLAYGVLIAGAVFAFMRLPTGFIPEQDQGYAIVAIQLPPGSSLSRTDAIVRQSVDRLAGIDAVDNTVAFAGFSGATFTNASNSAALFVVFKPMGERPPAQVVMKQMRQALFTDDAFIVVIPPPPVPGIGNAGGLKMMVQDRAGMGLPALEQAAFSLVMATNQAPETANAFTFFETKTPGLFLDIDRERARRLNVSLDSISSALQGYLGSLYVNDFTLLDRSFRVMLRADASFRDEPSDILRLRVANREGDMVPIGSLATLQNTTGPSRVARFNLYNAAAITAETVPGFSSGEAIARMEALATKVLPAGFGYEWTELAFQEKQQGNTAIYIFILAVVFVFLLLAAQYESWNLPLAVILIVPMCVLSAAIGLGLGGFENNVLTQIGLVVLVGLAAKNAILIVEFARQRQDEGHEPVEAVIYAARQRLRPILMTAASFVLGTLPLLVSTGPGFEMRRAIGTTVFSGMLGVTLFGLLFTPVFFALLRRGRSVPSKGEASHST